MRAAVLLPFLILGLRAWPAGAAPAWHGDLDSALAEAGPKAKFIFLEFTADWCPPCVQLEKEILVSDEGRKLLEPFVIARINVDTLDRWNYRGFETTNIPTIFLLDSSGRELTRITNYDKKSDFIELVDGFLKGSSLSDLMRKQSGAAPDNMDLRQQLHTYYLGTRQDDRARELMESVKVLASTAAAKAYKSMRFVEITSKFNRDPQDFRGVVREADFFAVDFPTSSFLTSTISYKARALWGLSRQDEAVELVKKLPDNFPEVSSAYWRLIEFSRLYKVLDKEAGAALERGARKFLKDDYFMMQGARWLIAHGEKQRAAELLKKAAEIAPANGTYKRLLDEVK